jgi:uncharacterized NAD-dependent epimerase/dehydratase family protein
MVFNLETALVLCEGRFGEYVGKTANGLVRHSERFQILGIIDSTNAGMMANEVVFEAKKGIPVFASLKKALEDLGKAPDYLIIGVATHGGMLPSEFRPIVKQAIENGMDVISGLHEFLCEDPEFVELAKEHGVKLIDVRKEPPLGEMKRFGDLCKSLPVLRIPVLGTDSSIGKRTTAIELTKALNEEGIKTVFVGTGQTGILQGFKYVIPIDSIQGDYMVGELERVIVQSYEEEKPQVILIEGQGSISHPAYVCGTRAVLMASQPQGFILQHAPGRKLRNFRKDELQLPMPDLGKEIEMLRIFSDSEVLAITLNHEGLNEALIQDHIRVYEHEFGIPCDEVLLYGCEKLVSAIKSMI